jgi:hypothetical protein
VEIRVFDLAGRPIKLLKGRIGEAYRFGDELKTGTYIAEVVQGDNRKANKLIRQ